MTHKRSRKRARSLAATLGIALTIVTAGCGTTSPASKATASTTRDKQSQPRRPAPSTSTFSTTRTAPTTTPPPVSCPAISGTRDVPGGSALIRSSATNHRRSAVIMLHGYTATTQGEETVSGWTNLLAGTDAVIAYPTGNPTPQGGYGWTTGTTKFSTHGTDDVGVIAQFTQWLVDNNCVDPNQIMIAGESNGSAMGLLLACSGRMPITPKLYALAIPAVDPHVTATCTNARPFPLVVFAGMLDQTVPYMGTPGDPSALSAPKSWFTQIMPGINKCASTTPQSIPVAGGSALSYSGCTATTTFFTIDQGHHTWPGGPIGVGGLNPTTFPAARLAWCASGLTATPTPVANCPELLRNYDLT